MQCEFTFSLFGLLLPSFELYPDIEFWLISSFEVGIWRHWFCVFVGDSELLVDVVLDWFVLLGN